MFIVLNTMVFYTFILVIIRRKEFIGQRRDDAAPLNRVVVDDEIRYRDQLTVSAVPTFYPGLTAYSQQPFVSQVDEYPFRWFCFPIEGPIHHHARETVDKITQLSHPWIIRKRTAQDSAVYVTIQSHELQVMFALSAANSSLSDL